MVGKDWVSGTDPNYVKPMDPDLRQVKSCIKGWFMKKLPYCGVCQKKFDPSLKVIDIKWAKTSLTDSTYKPLGSIS